MTPVAIAVGPPGAWALWTAPPNTPAEVAQSLAETFQVILPGWSVDSYVVAAGVVGLWARFVTEVAIHPAIALSPGDSRRLVAYLESVTADELTAVPTVWPEAVHTSA